MSETSTHDHILLLHSSCKTEDDGASPFEGMFATTGNDTAHGISALALLEETIFCDVLFIPEHPSSTLSEQDYLHLPNNLLNPCGLSNVLTLETLPKHWISGPILLSLSSCHILHHDNDSSGHDETTTSISLFVEPTPSTFVLDFSSEHNTHEGRNLNDNIIAVNKISEIHIEFDIREALMQVTGLLRDENSTRNNSLDNEGEPRGEDERKNQFDDRHPDDDKIDDLDREEAENDALHYDRHSILQPTPNRPTFDESIAGQNLDDRELLLRNLKAQLDQGSETIDLILFMSGFFFLLSLVVLLWSIYQFYRTNVKSDRLSQEIRQCMKKSHDMLQTAVEEMNIYQNHCANSLHQPAKEENSRERNYATTPKRDVMLADIYRHNIAGKSNVGDENHNQIEQDQTPVRLFAAKSSLTQKTDRDVLCETKKVEIEAPLSPLTSDSNDGDTRSVHADRKISLAPLSPCSQLEKKWNEGKTIRRSNLKKRKQYLKPFPNAVAIRSQSNTPCENNEDIARTMPRIHCTSNVIDENYQDDQPDHSCNILDPPKLWFTARASDLLDDARIERPSSDHTVKNSIVETERKAIAGLKTPTLNLVSQKAPPMCYTPASEDDSFVDDYW